MGRCGAVAPGLGAVVGAGAAFVFVSVCVFTVGIGGVLSSNSQLILYKPAAAKCNYHTYHKPCQHAYWLNQFLIDSTILVIMTLYIILIVVFVCPCRL